MNSMWPNQSRQSSVDCLILILKIYLNLIEVCPILEDGGIGIISF